MSTLSLHFASILLFFTTCSKGSGLQCIQGITICCCLHSTLLSSILFNLISPVIGADISGKSVDVNTSINSHTGSTLPHVVELSKEDRMLLDRAKWLVSRFKYQGDGEEGELDGLQIEMRKTGDRDRDKEEGEDEDSQSHSHSQGFGGVYSDKGLGEDLIPYVSPIAEGVRVKQRQAQVLFDGTSFEDDEGYDANVLSSRSRTSDVAANMLLSFVDFLSEVCNTQILPSARGYLSIYCPIY